MCTAIPRWTPWSWSVRIISRPVRSPTWASRGYLWPPKLRCRMRPSLVRSNRAPQASSSRTRSGASRACSSAIRQLFRYWPPRMVSAKWTRQLSRSSTLPIAAAIPPSAMTVWALPRSDLVMTATLTPRAEASIAARRPAPPAPITRTSVSITGNCIVGVSRRPGLQARRRVSENPEIRPDPHGQHPDIQVREADPDQTGPRPLHVPPVQAAHTGVCALANRPARHDIERAAGEMAERVTTKSVEPQEHHVRREDQRPDADAELRGGAGLEDGAPVGREPHGYPGVVTEDADEHDRDIQKVAMDVLDD